jgi:hypothetical protein
MDKSSWEELEALQDEIANLRRRHQNAVFSDELDRARSLRAQIGVLEISRSSALDVLYKELGDPTEA